MVYNYECMSHDKAIFWINAYFMNSKTKSLSDFPSNILSKILNNKKTDISHYDLVECISYHIILDSCIHNYH